MDEVAAARHGDAGAFEALVAPYRRELRAFCYKMAGSIDDADDLLQEGLLRAWRGLAGFEGRASVRSWLYRVTSSACLDALKHRSARKRAEDQGPAADPRAAIPGASSEDWIGPCPPALYADDAASPEARYGARQSVGFAFLAALQLLPPKQRATLIACDVLGWTAEECAVLLETTATSVNSALRRARDTLASRTPDWQPRAPDDVTTLALARYIEAWERVDAAALVKLLHDGATMSMPPLPLWLQGPVDIGRSIDAMVFATCTVDSFRTRVIEANGMPALAVYRRGDDGEFAAYALQVLGFDGDRVRSLVAFLDTRVFAAFDLPPRLTPEASG
jgi:RNA polymerase sigma-70 factor, ECF subfamily